MDGRWELKTVLIAIFLTAIFLGCVQMSAEDIAKKMQEKWKEVEDYSGVQSVTVTMNGKTSSAEYKFVFKKPNKIWMLDKTHDLLMVSNGKKLWSYDEKNKTVVVMNVSNFQAFSMNYSEIIKDILDKFDVKLLGEEKVAGRNCYVISLKPKSGLINETIKMWVDKTFWMPLKTELSMKGMKVVTEYKNLSINTGVSDDLFEFKPPEGVKVVTKENKFRFFKSVEEAQKFVRFRILTPKYTAVCKLRMISVINNVVDLSYINGSKYLSIEEMQNKSLSEMTKNIRVKVEEIKVGNSTAEYFEIYGMKVIIFKKGEIAIRISGNLSKDELIKVAESLQ